nr:reverse transcriptase domain-containing protein [Tanacetum cinerariifolium]
MTDQRTMAELLREPTEGYAEAIVVPPILAEQFELKHSLVNMMTSDQFFGLEKDNPHDHIRWFNKITSTIKYKDVPNSAIKLMLFPFSLAGAARRTTNLRNEISNFQQRFDESFHEAWDRYKDLLRACPHHDFTKLYQLDTFYNALTLADQDSLNAAAGGNLLERRTQDVLTIIENKSKVRNSRNKSVVSQVKSCDVNSSSEIAKLTHAVNQQTSDVTTAMTAILKQFQATPPPASVKAVEETCVTCGGARPITIVSPPVATLSQNSGIISKDTFQQLQLITIRVLSVIVLQTSLSNQTNEIKNMMASLLQMNTASTSGSGSLPSNTVANLKGELKAITTRSSLVIDGPTVPIPPKFVNPEEDERVAETLTDPDLVEYTIKVPPLVKKYKPPSQREYAMHQRKMLKALQSNKEKLQELANTPLNENCSAVILKKLPKKLGDPGKFLILCGFSELKCKALADLGASINLIIARDVFILVGKFTFPADFVIVDYESDPRVPLILGRHFLRTARALIDVHGKEMILHDGDERLTLNMRHDTSSYSNQPQKELINLINVFNNSSEDFLKDLFSNQPSGNPTFSELTSPEVNNDIFDSGGGNELANELSFITFPLKYDDDLQFDVESDLKEIEFMFHKDSSLKDSIDQKNLANLADNFVDSMPKMFTDEHALDYSSPSIFDEYNDDFLEVESDAKNVYDDPFDSKGEKIKESKLLIDELDLPCDFLPSEYDSFISQDFSRVDALPSTNNEDKVFNPGILIQEKPFEIITRVVQDKKMEMSNSSLVLEDLFLLFMNLFSLKKFPVLRCYSHFHLKMRKKFSNQGYTLLKKFILLVSQNYLIKAIKFSKSTKFSKAR